MFPKNLNNIYYML